MMTTKRTAIGRRLAVRRWANRPPWRGRKLGHGSIVAPFTATVAATLAATLAIGVGVALARAERDRRSTRTRGVRDRQLGLWPGERVADGLRRMALEQLDQAIELLEDDGGAVSAAHAVHETRKSLKRLRALVRLLEDGTGKRAFAEERATLRRAGERLARARDAEVMVSTLDGLLKRNAGGLARRRGVVKLRGRLVAERDRAVARALGDAGARQEVLDDLRSVRLRVMGWTLADRAGIKLVEPGLRRLYRQGRRDYRRAMRGKGERTRTMHQWRKRVKDLRYAAEMLDRAPADPAHGKGPSDIRRLARRADELGELLGEEHDLAVLVARLRAPARRGNGQGLEVGGGTRKTLLKLIARRRRSLRRKALRRGERLYRPRPKRFVRRVRELSRR